MSHTIMSMSAPPEASIKMYAGTDEMLTITQDGFYVRGVKVPVDNQEALTVYNSFKQWLVWHNLARN